MHRLATLALILVLLATSGSYASNLTVKVGLVEAASWQAEGLELSFLPPHNLQVRVARITVMDQPSIRELSLICRQLESDQGVRCDDVVISVTLPGWGRLEGRLQAHFHHSRRWQARLDIPSRKLELLLTQKGETLTAEWTMQKTPAAGLHQLANTMGLNLPGDSSGLLDLSGHAQLRDELLELNARITSHQLNYSEPSGRYAAEKLSANVQFNWDAAKSRLNVALETQEGQAYVEPMFMDFAVLPLQASAAIVREGDAWRIEKFSAVQGDAGLLELTGLLDQDYQPVELDARFEAADLAPLVATDVLPFLIGTQFDALTVSGRARGELALREGSPQRLRIHLDSAAFNAEKIGVALDGITGELNWSATGKSPDSQLQWRGGTLKRVPLGPSQLKFNVQAKDFTLAETWRQPMVGGALVVQRLALRELGQPQMAADFEGMVEPIDLAALCRALDWPEFGGTLAGQLPGLTVRDEVWSMDGALEAQVFDGRVRIENLRAIQPFGVLPRVMADAQVRRLDLEPLTNAFSFGRITGRLDGDVKGLRLLGWSPIAFDGRLYSTPGDNGSKRISQRAIDNISSIGGGPTGVVSRGFLGIFEDFSYSQIGISCVLRDDVCHMNGVEAAPPSKDGLQGYYLVKGRLLPRIDIVGYAQRVSLGSLIDQLQAAITSGGPELKP